MMIKIRTVAYLDQHIRSYIVKRAKYLKLSESQVINEMLEGGMDV